MNVTDRKVLSLNRNWQIIGIRTVAESFVAMTGGTSDNPPVKALDISYSLKENGEYDFESMPSIIPVSFVEWMSLPIRSYDMVINTAHNKMRVPTIIVSINYSKVPKKRFRPTKSVLYDLQKGICGLSGKKLTMKESNIEHKLPKSLGGKETFENLMTVDKKLNSKRGNKSYDEFGMHPIFNHREPKPLPVSFSIKNPESEDWKWFINK